MEVSRVQFIPPALAKLRSSPPAGDGWLFELKFDGWRVQLHKAGVSSAVYADFFPWLVPEVVDVAARLGLAGFLYLHGSEAARLELLSAGERGWPMRSKR